MSWPERSGNMYMFYDAKRARLTVYDHIGDNKLHFEHRNNIYCDNCQKKKPPITPQTSNDNTLNKHKRAAEKMKKKTEANGVQ